MRVYHFLSAQHALDDLKRRRLKIAQLDDLNDPFELLGVELSDRGQRRAFSDLKKTLSEKYGVICFSKSWSNPVLWSHYTEKHRGICLGFDVSEHLLQPATYSGRRIVLDIKKGLSSGQLNEDLMKKLLNTKYSDWKYEDEVRVFLRLEERDNLTGMYFKEFCEDIVLKQIILGARCRVTKTELNAYINRYDSSIKVIKARLAFKSFRIVENKAAFKK